MTGITRDVIQDLLPLYAAGEASADTRALVQDFLAKHPEMRAMAESARTAEMPSLPRPEEGLQALEWRSLDRTRRLLGRKTWLAALSLFFSILPMTFAYDFGRGRVVFLTARDQPAMAAFSFVLALFGWVAFLELCRQLSASGLQGPRSAMARTAWLVGGALLGIGLVLVLINWTGNPPWLWLLPGVFIGIAAKLGTRWRQVGEPRFRRRDG